MSGNELVDRHYQTPDPPSPYELICFRVYVPKHTLYIGAFWSAYQFFTTWLAWVRDPLNKGSQAAALWRTAYTKARALYEISNGRCDMNVTGVRQHPNDKCILQVEFDGNNVWVDVANFKDCNGCGGGGVMQFDGVNITQYNDCTGAFEPVGEPYNPTTSHIYDSLYSPDEEGRCNGAANIAAWSKYVSDETLSILASAGIAGAAASFVVGTLGSLAGAGFLTESLIAGLLAELETSGELLTDAAALDISSELRDILAGYTDDDGTIREPNFTEFVAALYARRDEEAVDTAARVRWGHEANIISALGPSVISRQNKYAGITDADCSGSGWTQVFDFTVSRQGWIQGVTDGANWVAGQGWHSVQRVDGDSGHWRNVVISVGMPSRELTKAKIYYTAELGVDTPSTEIPQRKVRLLNNAFTGAAIFDEQDTLAGENVYSWTGTEPTISTLYAFLTAGHDSVPPQEDPLGSATISKIVLSGPGSNPFI